MAASRPLISTQVSRASAAVLLLGGIAFLFAPDVILPRLIPAFPVAGAWVGQLVAAAWLGVATLNWLSRSALLGGIYGRPVVLTNAVLYFVAAMVLLKLVTQSRVPVAVWLLALPAVVFAAIYTWLLFRGPLERDFDIHRR
jgi:hypothetical protein